MAQADGIDDPADGEELLPENKPPAPGRKRPATTRGEADASDGLPAPEQPGVEQTAAVTPPGAEPGAATPPKPKRASRKSAGDKARAAKKKVEGTQQEKAPKKRTRQSRAPVITEGTKRRRLTAAEKDAIDEEVSAPETKAFAEPDRPPPDDMPPAVPTNAPPTEPAQREPPPSDAQADVPGPGDKPPAERRPAAGDDYPLIAWVGAGAVALTVAIVVAIVAIGLLSEDPPQAPSDGRSSSTASATTGITTPPPLAGDGALISLNGSASRQSALFGFPGGPATIRYRSTGGVLTVRLFERNAIRDSGRFSCAAPCADQGPIDAPAGEYYFDVQNTGGEWTVVLTIP